MLIHRSQLCYKEECKLSYLRPFRSNEFCAAVTGTDSEGADDAWVDSGVPSDNGADADVEGVVDGGRVSEVVVDDRVDEVVDDKDKLAREWTMMMSQEHQMKARQQLVWKKKYLYGKNVRTEKSNVTLCISSLYC